MKSLSLLQFFTSKEIENLNLFINSPFFKVSQKVKEIFHIIYSVQKRKGLKELDKDDLIHKILKDKNSINEQNISKGFHELFLVIEEYLIIKQLQKSPNEAKRLLVKSYSEKGLSSFFEKTTQGAVKDFEKQKLTGWNFHLHQFLIHHDIFLFPTTSKFLNRVESLEQANNNLDLFYCISKLKLGIDKVLRSKWTNESSNFFLLHECNQFAQQQSLPLLKLYANIFDLCKTQDFEKEKFEGIKYDFQNSFHLLSHSEKVLLLNFLINYISAFINRGEHQYFSIQLELFNLAITNKLHLEAGNQMTDTSFINMVVTFAFCKKFEEAVLFIQQNKKYLHQGIRQNAISLGKAYLTFHQDDFEKCISNIHTASESSTHYKFRSRSLYIRCYYERFLLSKEKYRSFLKSELTNYKQYFNRLKLLSPERKTAYHNLGNAIRQLFDIQTFPEGKLRTAKIKRLITFVESNNIVAKTWALQKIKEL